MDLYVQIIWKTNPTKVLTTRVSPERLAEYQANLGPAWDDIETFTVSVNPIAEYPAREVWLHDVEIQRDRNSQDFKLSLYDNDDKKAAVVKTTAVKLQEFALRVLQQTTYSFTDAVNR